MWLFLIELVVQVHVGKKDCDGLSLDTELLEIVFESQPASLSSILLDGCSVNPLVHLGGHFSHDSGDKAAILVVRGI